MERLDRILAGTGRWSRREIGRLVKAGRVSVDGMPAQAPDEKYDPDANFTVDGEPVSGRQLVYLMLHKPAGVISATEDPRKRTVLDLLPEHMRRAGLFPVGRLDLNSEGLLLFTNDGDFANDMTHPSRQVPKTYRVTVHSEVTPEQLVQLTEGIILDGERTNPAEVKIVTEEPGRSVMLITITEGRNREIRRMCESVGLEVARLKRLAVGPVKLGMLKPGTHRELTADEVDMLRRLAERGKRAIAPERRSRK